MSTPAALDLRIALYQWRPTEKPEDNLAQLGKGASQAVADGATLLVAPEYSHSAAASAGPHAASLAEPLDGPFVTGLRAISAESGGLVMVVGMLEASPHPAKPYNSLVMVNADGVLAVNRKIHLYDAFGHTESDWMSPAPPSDPQRALVDGWAVAGQTCYDLRFPEVTRRLVDFGADVIVIPAQWMPGPGKYLHWKTLIQARAIETQCYLVAVDQPEPHAIGHSLVIAPDGSVVLEMGGGEQLATVSITRELLDAVRQTNPVRSANRFRVDWMAPPTSGVNN